MQAAGYDSKKLPLGDLSEETIKQGYMYLKEIEKVLAKCKGKVKQKERGELQKLSSSFYSHIPHDFGRQNVMNFVIDTEVKLKEKIDLISDLSDIKLAFKKSKLVGNKRKQTKNPQDEPNPIDEKYENLHCQVQSLEESEADFKMIK